MPFDADAATVLERSDLFEGMSTAQMAALRPVCRERQFQTGEFLLHEGAADPFVYILVNGVAQIVKQTPTGNAPVGLFYLHPGDTLGELKIVDPQPSSASVIAATPVTAVEIDLASFDSPALQAVHASLVRNVAHILATRLRATTTEGAEAMQRELRESRARVHAGRFIALMFTMVATYQLALAALVLIPGTVRPSFTVLSLIFVVWTVIPVVLSLLRTPFSLETYGLTTRRAGSVAAQALLWTIPLLLLAVVAKRLWLPAQPLFDPAAMFNDRPFDPAVYLMSMLIYAIHAPAQELVARAGLQGALQNLSPAPGINWRAIIVADLLFAAAHAFIDFWFCIGAFVPGLFWGWMFARQRSLVGVIVSHIAVGLWVNFVVGF
ncbi:MAG TPA: cyclic nucleotide-binding domain-containing protein [Rhodopila sp.]|nr:cyclic nucleotide-binding domain-containing protein [Rhodopila sp.]